MLEVVVEEGFVDADHRLVIGQNDLEDPEVAHEAQVDVKVVRGQVHSEDVHCVGDHLELDLLAVVPMVVIDALVDERDEYFVF